MKTFFAIALAAVVGMASAVPANSCKSHKETCETDSECCGGSCQPLGNFGKVCFDADQCQISGPNETAGEICSLGTQCCGQGGCMLMTGFCYGGRVRIGGECTGDAQCYSSKCGSNGFCIPNEEWLLMDDGVHCESDAFCKGGYCNPETRACESRLNHPVDPIDPKDF
eukprot:Clim_evm9s10 gene=Clim_evmTU9s10